MTSKEGVIFQLVAFSLDSCQDKTEAQVLKFMDSVHHRLGSVAVYAQQLVMRQSL